MTRARAGTRGDRGALKLVKKLLLLGLHASCMHVGSLIVTVLVEIRGVVRGLGSDLDGGLDLAAAARVPQSMSHAIHVFHAIHFLCYHQHLFFVVIISTHIPDYRRPVDIGEPGVRPDIAAAAAEITEAAREVLREKL